jgi:hypothetical protein
VNWFEACVKAHERTFPYQSRLSSLPNEWEREMAALWRLEADVNNGGCLQFFCNWGQESYLYASAALRKIGAHKMAEIVDACKALVDEHVECAGLSFDELREKLPEEVVARIYELSYKFIE